jgi:hypothetical protein
MFSGLDTTYLGGYDSNGELSNMVPSTPVTSLFDTPGLPFKGLDYIRNYNHHGTPGRSSGSGGLAGDGGSNAFDSGHSMDSMWQSYDPSAFEFDPGMPFNLGSGFGDLEANGNGVHSGSASGGSGQQS